MRGQTTQVGNEMEGQAFSIKNKSHQGSERYNSPQKTCVPPRISHHDYNFPLILAALSHFPEPHWTVQRRYIWHLRVWEGEGAAGPHRAAPLGHPNHPLSLLGTLSIHSSHSGALGDSLYSLSLTRAMDPPVPQKCFPWKGKRCCLGLQLVQFQICKIRSRLWKQ